MPINPLGMDMYHWSVMVGGMTCTIGLILMQRWSWGARLLAAYFACYSVAIMFWLPSSRYEALFLAVKLGSIRTWFAVLMVPLVVGAMTGRVSIWVRHFFFALMVANALYRGLDGGTFWIGTTQDNLILAIFLPYFYQFYRQWALVALLPMVTGLMTHAGLTTHESNRFYDVGQGAVVVVVVQLVLLAAYRRNWKALGVSMGATALMLIPLPLSGFNPMTQRWDLLDQFTRHFEIHANPWFGFGPGTFEWVQGMPVFKWKWVWMHSDWVQIGWETGFVGLIGAILFYLFLLWKVRDEYYKFATLAGLGIGMLIYSPIQFFWTQALVVMVIKGDE